MKSRFGAIGCALKRANFRLILGTTRFPVTSIYRMPDGTRIPAPENRVGRLTINKDGSITLSECTDPEVLLIYALVGNS